MLYMALAMLFLCLEAKEELICSSDFRRIPASNPSTVTFEDVIRTDSGRRGEGI